MNGFTAGKVLIFIPLSDFCWLLLISNTQRKASESINKEMNTLHRATAQILQSLTRDMGLRRRPGLHLARYSMRVCIHKTLWCCFLNAKNGIAVLWHMSVVCQTRTLEGHTAEQQMCSISFKKHIQSHGQLKTRDWVSETWIRTQLL